MAAAETWRLWVDSGGTFTDCLALAPDGTVRRAKVLSSGALRARVREVLRPGTLALDPPPSLPPGLLPGLELRALGAARGPHIVAVADDGRTVELDRAADELRAGCDVELFAGETAPVLAARLVTATPLGVPLPPLEVRLASTRGTNALLEGKGSRTALFVSRGFADLLAIGDQQRPDLFALEVVKTPPLYEAVVEVDERLAADGSVLDRLDLAGLEETARRLHADGVRAAAVALLHAYRNPAHERVVGARLREVGFEHVSLSADLSPRIKILPRARTAVVDAYLSAAVATYVESVAAGLGPRSFHLMTSAGGLAAADVFRPKDSLLSGPAGGVLGAAAAGRRSGGERLLAFDMGGTSTDVSRFDGALEYRRETRVGDALLASLSVDVETVAAGGGSICFFDGRQLKVGPESAGASPGPACYGAGGPLTLTDVNLLLGRIDVERFAFRVDREAARAAAASVGDRTAAAPARGEAGLDELLAGFLRIANEKMAAAVRRTAVRKGYRPDDYWLVAFGGAGPQHACAVAELLGIRTALVPADAALLSAVGLGGARIERFATRQILAPCADVEPRLAALFADAEAEARAGLRREGVGDDRVEVRLRRAHLRFFGQESTLAVELPTVPGRGALEGAFRRRYRELFGYEPAKRAIELESLDVLVASAGEPVSASALAGRGQGGGGSGAGDAIGGRRRAAAHRLHAGGRWRQAWAVERRELASAEALAGPGLVLEPHCATVVEPGWRAEVDAAGAILLRRTTDAG